MGVNQPQPFGRETGRRKMLQETREMFRQINHVHSPLGRQGLFRCPKKILDLCIDLKHRGLPCRVGWQAPLPGKPVGRVAEDGVILTGLKFRNFADVLDISVNCSKALCKVEPFGIGLSNGHHFQIIVYAKDLKRFPGRAPS